MADSRFTIEFVDRGGSGGTSPGPPSPAPAGPGPVGPSAATPVPAGNQPQQVAGAQQQQSAGHHNRPGKPPRPPVTPGAGTGLDAARAVSGAMPGGAALARAGTIAGAVALPFLAARALGAEAEELAPFSPDISIARAENQARKTIRNLEDARRFGPDIAEFERSKGKLGREFDTFKRSVLTKGGGIGDATEVLGGILEGLNKLNQLADDVSKGKGTGIEKAIGTGINFVDRLGKIVSGLAAIEAGANFLRNREGNLPVNVFAAMAKPQFIDPGGSKEWSGVKGPVEEVDLDEGVFLNDLPDVVPFEMVGGIGRE